MGWIRIGLSPTRGVESIEMAEDLYEDPLWSPCEGDKSGIEMSFFIALTPCGLPVKGTNSAK